MEEKEIYRENGIERAAESSAMELVENQPLAEMLNAEAIDKLEKSIILYRRYEIACLKSTHAGDWVNFGGRFYFTGPGCERIASRFGIVWQKPHIYKEINSDGSYAYFCEGIIESRSLKRYIWAIGRQDSKSLMSRSPATLESDIKIAAVSNWQIQGITRLLGMRNPSVEMLKEAGINIAQIKSVDFKEGDRAAASKDRAAKSTASIEPASEAQLKLLGQLCSKLGWGAEVIKKVCGGKTGRDIKSRKELTKKEASDVIDLLSKFEKKDAEAMAEVDQFVMKAETPKEADAEKPEEEKVSEDRQPEMFT